MRPGVGHGAGQATVPGVCVQLRGVAGVEAAVIAGDAGQAHDEGVGLPGPALRHWVGGAWRVGCQ